MMSDQDSQSSVQPYSNLGNCSIILCHCISIYLWLSQQLQTLSAAAHLVLFLYANWDVKSHFMPSQLYGDLQIMIQNVFFCVAKQKILNNDEWFFLCQLGTD